MSRILLLFAFLFSFSILSEAQTSLSGKIVDNESGEVIIGATVVLKRNGVHRKTTTQFV